MRKSVNARLFIIGILLFVTACKKKNDPPSASSDAFINSFTFRGSDNPSLVHDVIAKVSNDTILIGLKAGTNVTNLIPNIDFIGASINPLSNVVQNFTNSILYTVTAQNGIKEHIKPY
jgi:hypothetical protein